MSLITRCPACQTLFRVVPDQLRISEGWVRCGQCNEGFDASQNLFQELVASGTEVSHSRPEPANGQPGAETNQDLRQDESLNEIQLDLPREDLTATSGEVQPDLLHNSGSPVKPIEAIEPVAVDLSEQLAQDVLTTQITQNPSQERPTVSFMKAMPQSSGWHQPLARAALGLTSFVLVVGLAVQVVVHERDRLAATQAQIRPVLDALCAALKCGVSPVRQIESIVIDNSSFSKVRADTFRLGLSVKNTAAIDLAMPSFELTLTDSQSQTVLRRVLLPAEFGAADDVLATGREWSGNVALNVRGAMGAENISGYRVLAFYP